MEMAHANFKGNCWRLRWTPDGPLKTHFSIFMSCVTPQRNLTLGSPVGMGAGKKQGCVPDTRQPGCQQLKNTFFLPKPNLNPQTVYSMSWNGVWHLLKQEDLSQVFYQLRCQRKIHFAGTRTLFFEKNKQKSIKTCFNRTNRKFKWAYTFTYRIQKREHKRPTDSYSWCSAWHHSSWEPQACRDLPAFPEIITKL